MKFIFYVGIIFFLIGAWQAFMMGRKSQIISGASLILGTVFIFMGNWHAGLFLIFMYVTWFLLMHIFRFSTYHKYFFGAVTFLIAYAFLVSFLLDKFGFQYYFWWYLFLTLLLLGVNNRKQWRLKEAVAVLSKEDPNTIDMVSMIKHEHELDLDEILQMKSVLANSKPEEIELSGNRTIKYHFLSSLVYILSLIFAFMYFAI